MPSLRNGLIAGAVASIVIAQSAAGLAAIRSVRISHRPTLFIADQHTNAVYALDASNLDAPPLAKITSGINTPTGLAVDANGVLYVSNIVSIAEYRPGSVTPFRTLPFTQGNPNALAVGRDGTLAVAEEPPILADGHLVIFDKGSPVPTRTITIPLKGNDAVFLGGVAIDAAGDVFLSVTRYPRGPAEHLEVAAGSVQGVDTQLPAGNSEGFDAQGNFYIGFGSQINVYAPRSNKQIGEITRGLTSQTIFAVSPTGGLFVPNSAHLVGGIGHRGDLLGFAPGGKIPSVNLRSHVDIDPRGAALRL